MKIEIDINGVHKDEIEELKKYLEENCWKWKAASSKQQATSLTGDLGYCKISIERNNHDRNNRRVKKNKSSN